MLSSTTTVIELHFFMKKKKKKKHEDEEFLKYLYFIPHVTFSSNFLHAVIFLHVLHLDVLRGLKYFLMYGYNAGPPMAIPIYTVLPYCVINDT